MSGHYKLVPEAHLFFVQNGRILLLRRRNTGYEDGSYSVPAGHMEAHETAREAACRECREETGIVLAPDDLDFAHLMHRNNRGERFALFFAPRRWQGEPAIMEPDKCDDLPWVALDALPGNLIAYVRQALALWRRGVPYSEYWQR